MAYVRKPTNPTTILNDSTVATNSTWTSNKINSEFMNKADLVGGIIPLFQIPPQTREVKVVSDYTGRDALQAFSGMFAYITSTQESFVYDGTSWNMVGTGVSIDWVDIAGKPTSTPSQIDSAVGVMHTHSNKPVLDALSDSSGTLMYNGSPISGAGATINDSTITSTETWSSSNINTKLSNKADTTTVNSQLANKADNTSLATKADLVNGAVPLSQLPAQVKEIRVVADLATRDALSPYQGMVARVLSNTSDYIWDGTAWQPFGSGVTVTSIDWSGINNKPTSTVTQIDNSVSQSHTHANASVLNKFSEASGVLKYNGVAIGSGATAQIASWQQYTGYTAGDVIVYNNALYKANTAHVSGTNFFDTAGYFDAIGGASSGLSKTTVTKLGITLGRDNSTAPSTTNPYEVEIATTYNVTFEDIPIEVKKLVTGTQNKTQNLFTFSNAEANSFVHDDYVAFDGTMKLATTVSSPFVNQSTLGSGTYGEWTIDMSQLIELQKLEVV